MFKIQSTVIQTIFITNSFSIVQHFIVNIPALEEICHMYKITNFHVFHEINIIGGNPGTHTHDPPIQGKIGFVPPNKSL